MSSKKRAWEHLTLYGIDLPANDINMKSKDYLQKMCASVLKKRVLKKRLYLQQQVESGDEDGEGNASLMRGVNASVWVLVVIQIVKMQFPGQGMGRIRKGKNKGSEGDQDGK